MIETKLSSYITAVEKTTREILRIDKAQDIPQLVSKAISSTLGDNVQYAFIDLGMSKIYESAIIDSTVKHILPFFLDPRFIEEIKKLDWSVIDQKGIRFLFEKIGGQTLDIETSFLIIPNDRRDQITHFSVLWGGKILERIDKDEIDFISSLCHAVELRMLYIITAKKHKSGEGRELRMKAFELKEISGIGVDLTSLGKEDFFGSYLLNVMGRSLSKTAVIVLSTNENNTEYAVVASRGIPKKQFEKIHFSDRASFVKELRRTRIPIEVTSISKDLTLEEKEVLEHLESSVLFPLLLKNGLIGILSLGERINLQPYPSKVFDSIQMISNQMVMAIENSKLSNLRYAFSRYVSHQLVDGIMSDPEQIKLGGERRKITVLFADIRGFTTMTEKMRPEDVVDLLNTYLSGLTDVVFKYEGTLDKYIGDCVMAVFGAPIAHYNDTERAVIAAIEMQKYVDELNRERQEEGFEKVEIGVGINTGYVISGNMGSVDRMDYTVIGDVVNTASRLEGFAGRGQIVVTKEVYEEVKYFVDAHYLSAISVKGKEKPVEVYLVKDLIASKYLNAVEKREPYISGHFLNIARDTELIGKELGFSSEDLVKIRASALLIDVGRIGLDEKIFNKKERLSPEEFEVVKSHVLRGAEYVQKKLNLFKEGVDLVRHHHEFWDGSGYPDGLKGKDIPLWARIVCVVDNYHALIADRPFRKSYPEEEAMKMLKQYSGKKYDSEIVDIYLKILSERLKSRGETEI
jgi:HD-GYP domain-containing protein (c-di-GMP phosphodiesterase class II)